MPIVAGTALYLEFCGQNFRDTPFRSISWSADYATADTTVGTSPYETHALLTESVEFDVSLYSDSGEWGTVLVNGRQGTLVIGPNGNTTGDPKFSCVATVVSRSYHVVGTRGAITEATLVRNGNWIANFDNGDLISSLRTF